MLKNIREWKGWHPIYYGKTWKNKKNMLNMFQTTNQSYDVSWYPHEKQLHWNWPQQALHFMGLAVECSRRHRPRRTPSPELAAAMDPWDRFPKTSGFNQGLVIVLIEHHPNIGDIYYIILYYIYIWLYIITNKYLKMMFKIPKTGHLPTPDNTKMV